MTSIKLAECLAASGSEDFAYQLASALTALPAGSLPLQSSCDHGGLVDDSAISASVLSVDHSDDRIVARVGIFFTEVIGGCNCNDDLVEANAYCLLEVAIGRTDGVTTFTPQQA